MLEEKTVKEFIEKYEKYYFSGTYENDNIQNELGIERIKSVKIDHETKIMKKLEMGIHDADVIAWKMGIYKGKEIEDNIVKAPWKKFELKDYIYKVNSNKTIILDYIKNGIEYFEYHNIMNALKEFAKVFEILKTEKVDKFGNVYFINSMFFLSKGAIPIYDHNVYKAVQALYKEIKPQDVKESQAPHSDNSVEAAFRLIEYMLLLNEVFGFNRKIKSETFVENKSDRAFISRGLDRALWVYGQSYKED